MLCRDCRIRMIYHEVQEGVQFSLLFYFSTRKEFGCKSTDGIRPWKVSTSILLTYWEPKKGIRYPSGFNPGMIWQRTCGSTQARSTPWMRRRRTSSRARSWNEGFPNDVRSWYSKSTLATLLCWWLLDPPAFICRTSSIFASRRYIKSCPSNLAPHLTRLRKTPSTHLPLLFPQSPHRSARTEVIPTLKRLKQPVASTFQVWSSIRSFPSQIDVPELLKKPLNIAPILIESFADNE